MPLCLSSIGSERKRIFESALVRRGDLIFVQLPLNPHEELDDAIHTVGVATLDWLERRGVKIRDRDTATQHVALMMSDSNTTSAAVVEAVRGAGVRTRTLTSFLAAYPSGTQFYHGRLRGITDAQAEQAVAVAKAKVGMPYADNFAEPSGSCEQYYCSSLVDYAYRSALGQNIAFTCEPFPLLFEPRKYWEDYYASREQVLPECFGSNPTLLMHSQRVEYRRLLTIGGMPENMDDETFTLDLENDIGVLGAC